MKCTIWVFILILSFGMGPGLQAGEIYQWVDQDGVLHFTDGPPPPGAQIVEGLSETPSDTPPASTEESAVQSGDVQDDDTSPTGFEDTGAVEGSENDVTGREEFWRSRGWGENPPGAGETGAAEDEEGGPADREEDIGNEEGDLNRGTDEG